MGSPGHFILSLDVELAWGTFDHGGDRRIRDQLLGEREAIRRLLDLLARHELPATFALVGHLFLDSCRRENGTTHPEGPAPALLLVRS
jgi:peptidoglycan/xylan/chitin deacetylase (PgdA/CDA1 family)